MGVDVLLGVKRGDYNYEEVLVRMLKRGDVVIRNDYCLSFFFKELDQWHCFHFEETLFCTPNYGIRFGAYKWVDELGRDDGRYASEVWDYRQVMRAFLQYLFGEDMVILVLGDCGFPDD